MHADKRSREFYLFRGVTTARMYRGPAPSIRMDKIFGTTTLELG